MSQLKSGAEDLNKHFSQEAIQRATGRMKRCSTPLITMEMQSKTTMRCPLTPVRGAVVNKSTDKKCWGDVEKGDPCALLVRSDVDAATVGHSTGGPQKPKLERLCDPAAPLLGTYLKKLKTLF